jgi:F0F1-type ATP synthase assembly protein I
MQRWVAPSAYFLGIGWYFVVCVVGGVLIGRWLDGRFDSAPVFALIGTFSGLALALYGAFRMLNERLLKPGRPRDRESHPPGGTS